MEEKTVKALIVDGGLCRLIANHGVGMQAGNVILEVSDPKVLDLNVKDFHARLMALKGEVSNDIRLLTVSSQEEGHSMKEFVVQRDNSTATISVLAGKGNQGVPSARHPAFFVLTATAPKLLAQFMISGPSLAERLEVKGQTYVGPPARTDGPVDSPGDTNSVVESPALTKEQLRIFKANCLELISHVDPERTLSSGRKAICVVFQTEMLLHHIRSFMEKCDLQVNSYTAPTTFTGTQARLSEIARLLTLQNSAPSFPNCKLTCMRKRTRGPTTQYCIEITYDG